MREKDENKGIQRLARKGGKDKNRIYDRQKKIHWKVCEIEEKVEDKKKEKEKEQ